MEIAEYFPGYIRNRELWARLKGKSITSSTLIKFINNEINIGQIDILATEINRGKKEIIREKLLELNNFTEEELKLYKNEFEEDHIEKNRNFHVWLRRAERSDRQKLLGGILVFSTRTIMVDNFFNRIENDSSIKNKNMKETLNGLEIIESRKGGKNAKIKYMDKYDLSSIFKGFEKNKSFWNSIKGRSFNHNEFWDIVYDKRIEQSSLNRFI